jgi:hypothetical protein
MLIEATVAAALLAVQWFWSGSEGPAGKHFIANYVFIADETSKYFVEIDDVELPKRIGCESLFRWFNRYCHPEDENMTEAEIEAIVGRIVDAVKSGGWHTSSKVGEHKLGKYSPNGRWDC